MESNTSPAPLHQVVGQLRELRDKATPGPWAIANWGYADDPHMIIEGPEIPKPATREGFWFGGQKAVDWGDDWNADNAALIVAAINALPALLAIAEAADAVMALRGTIGYSEKTRAYDALASALSLLPNTVLDGPKQDEQADSRRAGGGEGEG